MSDDEDIGFDTHHLLFGSPSGPPTRALSTTAHSDIEEGSLHTNLLERSDSLLHSNHSLHMKLHQTQGNSDKSRGISMGSLDGRSSRSSSQQSNSLRNSRRKREKKKKGGGGKQSEKSNCFPCFGGGGNNMENDDDDDEMLADDKSDDSFYEMLFGAGNEHAAYDRHKQDVNRLLDQNPSSFPSFLPNANKQTFSMVFITSAYILAIFFVPKSYLEWVPPPYGDEWSKHHMDNNAWEVRQTLLAYSSIPIVSCIFTYFHIWLALFMMFYPIGFIGCWQIPGTNIGFPLGWQGIVPFKAVKMVAMSVDIILGRLINMKDEFGKIKPDMVAGILKPSLAREVADMYPAIASRHKPELWDRLPESMKDVVISTGVAMASGVVADLMSDIQENLDELINIKKLVTEHFLKHPALMNSIFIQCGYQELVFIRNSGGFFGFLFGLIQMIVWLFWHPSKEVPLHANLQGLVVFPVFGLVVGAATNWISLLVIFSPVEPFDILKFLKCKGNGEKQSPFTHSTDKSDTTTTAELVKREDPRERSWLFPNGLILHGLFLQRQSQVSRVYGRLVGSKVLTVSRIHQALLTGSTVPQGNELLNKIMTKHFTSAFDKSLDQMPSLLQQVGIKAETFLGEAEVNAMRQDAVNNLLKTTPIHLQSPKVTEYFEGALGLELTLRDKMEQLPSADFEQILHPVFQEDEWKLIAVGGLLGVVIGLLQAFFIN